jgi:hypothetical protein
MKRTAPGLVIVLLAMLCAAPAVEAGPCKGKRACKAQAKKPHKPTTGTGWIDGTYNGGPGDPIIAPLPSLPGR